jgi:DNA-binding transcriptional ArsR family regulator
MKSLFHPTIDNITLEQILYALSDPTRLTIFFRLFNLEDEKSCSYFDDLAKKNNLSHHFKILRESGIIKVRIEGRHRFISLRKEEVNLKFPQLFDTIYCNCNIKSTI